MMMGFDEVTWACFCRNTARAARCAALVPQAGLCDSARSQSDDPRHHHHHLLAAMEINKSVGRKQIRVRARTASRSRVYSLRALYAPEGIRPRWKSSATGATGRMEDRKKTGRGAWRESRAGKLREVVRAVERWPVRHIEAPAEFGPAATDQLGTSRVTLGGLALSGALEPTASDLRTQHVIHHRHQHSSIPIWKLSLLELCSV
jgi:hypothetical protein